MSYMKQVAEMLGLSWDDEKNESEEFKIENFESIFRFNEQDLLNKVDIECECSLYTILNGKFKIKKLPWKPKLNEMYYVSDITRPHLYICDIWNNTSYDLYLLNNNLVFKTEDEAVEDSKKTLKLREEQNGY